MGGPEPSLHRESIDSLSKKYEKCFPRIWEKEGMAVPEVQKLCVRMAVCKLVVSRQKIHPIPTS